MKKFLALSLLIIFMLASCARPTSHSDIRFAIAQAPINLDPRYATDASSERINRLIYRQLIDFDEASKPKPDLAEWQKIGPTQYRFFLKQEGRVFHDGSSVSAEDVAATYGSLLALKDSPHAAEFANIRQVKVLDANTLDFYLKQPDEDFVSRLIVGILPARLIVSGYDFSHRPLGSGSFKFLSWNGAVRLERISDHQLFSIEEVKDPTVRVLKLIRGEVDLLQGDLPPELVNYIKSKPELAVLENKGSNFSYLGFNMQDEILKNMLVRQAVAHAIDRQAIIEKALVAGSRQAGAILPPEHWAGNANLIAYDYNPKLSRELLAQAGVKLPLKLVYKTSTDAQRVRLATILQAQMREAGIELEIHSLDWGTFFDDIKHGKFQLYGLTWVGIKTPEIYRLAFHSQSTPPNGANRGRYADAELDQMIDGRDWPAATTRIHQQLPYIPLWYEGQFAAIRHGLLNYELKPDGNWDGLATISKHEN